MVRIALIVAVATLAAPVFAQTASTNQAQLVAGAPVVDTQGAPVGTVTSVGPDYVGVRTDKYEVRLPKASFGARDGSWSITLSRADLNASVEKSLGNVDELLKQGTAVAGAQRTPIGTVDSVEGDLVTVKLLDGKLIRLQKSAFGPGPNGLVIGLTAEQLRAQTGGAGS